MTLGGGRNGVGATVRIVYATPKDYLLRKKAPFGFLEDRMYITSLATKCENPNTGSLRDKSELSLFQISMNLCTRCIAKS